MAAACELPYSKTAQQSAKQQNTGDIISRSTLLRAPAMSALNIHNVNVTNA